MTGHPIDYYDFNLKFYFCELKEAAPSAAGKAAPFIRKFLEEIVLSVTASGTNARQEHYDAALNAFLEFKRILVKVFPDYVDDSEQDKLTSEDLQGLSNGYRELTEFLKDNPESSYNLSWIK